MTSCRCEWCGYTSASRHVARHMKNCKARISSQHNQLSAENAGLRTLNASLQEQNGVLISGFVDT
eukprot:6045401-Prymnesium_polylepis.1